MSALTTRMLVLGVVRIFGPANGYQLRRELLSWEVESWAQLNPGSIYSMLGSLERDRLVDRHDLTPADGGRSVAVYTVTAEGETEFVRLVRDAIRTLPDTGDPLPLRVALNFGPVLTRADFVAAGSERIELLAAGREAIRRKIIAVSDPLRVPPHVVVELELEDDLAKAQYDWLLRLAARVQGGALDFADDENHGAWTPPPDDPGWRMQAEREEYARLLAQRGWEPVTGA